MYLITSLTGHHNNLPTTQHHTNCRLWSVLFLKPNKTLMMTIKVILLKGQKSNPETLTIPLCNEICSKELLGSTVNNGSDIEQQMFWQYHHWNANRSTFTFFIGLKLKIFHDNLNTNLSLVWITEIFYFWNLILDENYTGTLKESINGKRYLNERLVSV